MLSLTEENYLKAIFHLEQTQEKGVATNAIAEKMNTKASSVTDMMHKLSEKKLVVYKKYQGVKLTAEGTLKATIIVRKHRLWECFLVDKLSFSWDEVHDIAEQLEHIKSEALVDKLDQFLGFPTTDPHGDPIPDKDGKIHARKKVELAALKENQKSVLLSVNDSSDAFLRYLDKKEIAIGSLAIEPFDNSMLVKIDSNEHLITEEVARNLLVKEIANK